MIPNFLRHPDPDWSRFTPEQVRVITGLRKHWRGRLERDFAAVPLLLDDGSAKLVKLTIALVEPHARRCWSGIPTASFTFPSDQ